MERKERRDSIHRLYARKAAPPNSADNTEHAI